MGILHEVESVIVYETAATGAGKLHRFETVLSIVNLIWLRVARKSYQGTVRVGRTGARTGIIGGKGKGGYGHR
jgi:hypothetical protein